MMDATYLVDLARSCPTRERASELAKQSLHERGWFIVDKDEFDVIAVKGDGTRMVIKFWISPEKRPIPVHYIKKFDRDIQEFIRKNEIRSKVDAFLVANTDLDPEARGYYRTFARFTMKVQCVLPDKAVQPEIAPGERQLDQKGYVQKELLHFISIA
jgi:hypothetical protein